MAKTITLEMLAQQMQKGFASIDTRFASIEMRMQKSVAAVADDVADIKRDMATKDQIIALHTQTNSIERELRDIKLTLTRVLFREDMDAALERIAAIERHLGLNKKIAA
jgi:hypothetical protein